MEIKELNKKQELIAKFMGIKNDKSMGVFFYRCDLPFIKDGDYGSWASVEDKYYRSVLYAHYELSVSHLKYHSSWDWLIPVMQRVTFVMGGKLYLEVNKNEDGTTIEDIFNSVYILIKDYYEK